MIINKGSYLAVSLSICSLMNNVALANGNIPTVDEIMGSDVKKSNVWDTLYAVAGAVIALAILCVIAWVFLEIVHGGVAIYSEIKAERKTWAALGGHIIGGVALLGIGVVVSTYTVKLFS
ncbi:DUF2976 domain-containing protein [Vibrio fluvialis]|nr:DUF2976 domain-containing protein [Vibrio fluvialis]